MCAAKFWWYFLFLFLTLLYYTYYGLMAIVLSPSLQARRFAGIHASWQMWRTCAPRALAPGTLAAGLAALHVPSHVRVDAFARSWHEFSSSQLASVDGVAISRYAPGFCFLNAGCDPHPTPTICSSDTSLSPQMSSVASTMFYAIWSMFAGFLIMKPDIPGWWIWYYYLCPGRSACWPPQLAVLAWEPYIRAAHSPARAICSSCVCCVLLSHPSIKSGIFSSPRPEALHHVLQLHGRCTALQ